MSRFFTSRTAGRFFPGGPQRIKPPRQKLVFSSQADLPDNPCCTKIGFVTSGDDISIFVYSPPTGWEEYAAGGPGGGIMSFPQETFTMDDNDYTYTVTINGGDVDTPEVVGAYVFRNGVFLPESEYTLAAGVLTLDAGQPAPVNGEELTLVLAIQTP